MCLIVFYITNTGCELMDLSRASQETMLTEIYKHDSNRKDVFLCTRLDLVTC